MLTVLLPPNGIVTLRSMCLAKAVLELGSLLGGMKSSSGPFDLDLLLGSDLVEFLGGGNDGGFFILVQVSVTVTMSTLVSDEWMLFRIPLNRSAGSSSVAMQRYPLRYLVQFNFALHLVAIESMVAKYSSTLKKRNSILSIVVFLEHELVNPSDLYSSAASIGMVRDSPQIN